MKAVIIKELGPLENLEYVETDEPRSPGAGEVVLRVTAAGINRADLIQVAGHYPPPAGYDPMRPGMEFAGEIETLGSGVEGWSTGDRVFGITAGEAQAERLVIDASLLCRIPDGLPFAQAAGIAEVFITAHDAIFTRGLLNEGETLLIHAAGSGVGLAGLQIAKAFGATVIGTSRTADKLDRCKQLGLDDGIVTTGDDFAESVLEYTGGKGADVILDLVGGGYFEQNLRSLALKGRLVLVGLTSGREANFNLGLALQKRATIVGTTLRGRSIEEKADATRRFERDVLPLIAAGRVSTNIDRIFAAADVVAAYQYVASNQTFGKVVLEF